MKMCDKLDCIVFFNIDAVQKLIWDIVISDFD